ncbi:transporter substrate-binding domain-containing protein [Enterococcus sp. DIV0242_7C1]|uniref:Amino acid ABC transporter amino acid-binding protein n=1 Tax=Candidatus Enterococcus dunnyi TaxID=1834192 RepID=A0A200JFV0_9ENTE|nr:MULTISPECIES: transporter substrate-binding domain-containing protein [unclassified Enterococcus]MBO0469141.1 transporter substrate-binding domain-containing protein [Enterococcus sp. DIV0242_7C1]MCA5012725.1 transporter substrate-binding domain-containing protein [Enterococcus sp. S23]MCA5015976.1 transporter substrate-binding domain-containing protein [Enterococcus sp. S22(2020)]OUZ35565.1 amino acid ABC transporter amino acid-binding protein [Enterococcus sp. 9D6_DIV0238]
MKKMKKIVGALSLTLLLGLVVGCSSGDDTKSADSSGKTTDLQKIKDAGVIKVGVKEDVPNFGYMNPDTNKNEGMEPDIARLLAKELTGSEDNVEFVGVTAKTRGPLLDNGELDMVIATFTITDERKETYNFTTPYYKDEVGFLVRKADKFTDTKSLDGKTIGVVQSSTTKDAIEKQAKELGVTFKYQELGSYPELKTALTSKRIDAFSVDKSILTGYVDDNTEILKDGFSPQEYGIATKKSNTELNDFLNESIEKWEKDGTLDKIYKTWNLN